MKPCNVVSTHTLCFAKYPVTSFHDAQSFLHCPYVCSTRHPDIYIACVHLHGAFQHRPQASEITSQSPPHSDRHSGLSAPNIWKITSAQSNPQTAGSSGQVQGQHYRRHRRLVSVRIPTPTGQRSNFNRDRATQLGLGFRIYSRQSRQ